MVLGFKQQFKEKILNGSKIHTIRIDKNNRWKVGMPIQFATGVRTKKYECFKKVKCVSVQEIELNFWNSSPTIIIEGKRISYEQSEELAKNDGFEDLSGLMGFFGIKNIKAKLIHWTDFKY